MPLTKTTLNGTLKLPDDAALDAVQRHQPHVLVMDLSLAHRSGLSLIEEMQAVDTRGIEPMAHAQDLAQRLRADCVTESNRREAFQAVAPETEAGLYLVPKVIE